MKTNHIIAFLFFSFVISTDNICMEKKNIIPYIQQRIIISCSDGKYELDKWKVFESISLYEHCLAHDKNFESIQSGQEMPLCVQVDIEKMDLFSEALDIKPGPLFKEHIDKLTPENRRKLIIVAGKHDENGIAQLNAPGLTGELVDAFFLKEIRNQIKPYMQRSEWHEHCINEVVKNNLTSSILPKILWGEAGNSLQILRHDNGSLSRVPSCLSKDGSLYNGPLLAKRMMIDNVEWALYESKIIEGDWEHCITGVESLDSGIDAPGNKRLLWAINNDTKSIEKTVIEHKNDINRGFFSKNGEYAVTVSDNEVFLSKIIHQKDGTCSFDTFCIDSYINANRFTDVSFNNQSTMFITCFYDNQQDKGGVKLWNMSGNLIAELEGNYGSSHGIWSPDDSRLLIYSTKLEELSGIIWDMALTKLIAEITWPETNNYYDYFDYGICSPHGNDWALTTAHGDIFWIYTLNDCYKKLRLTELSDIVGKNKINIVFSSDNRFLIALIPQKSVNNVMVWSTLTGEKIASTFLWIDGKSKYGIGITSKNREIVAVSDDILVSTRPLLQEEDDNILSGLWDSTVYGLHILRRLHLAHKNKEIIELYEEEPAYKALISLQKEPYNVATFVKQYLAWKVINNKKDVAEFLQEAWQNFLS